MLVCGYPRPSVLRSTHPTLDFFLHKTKKVNCIKLCQKLTYWKKWWNKTILIIMRLKNTSITSIFSFSNNEHNNCYCICFLDIIFKFNLNKHVILQVVLTKMFLTQIFSDVAFKFKCRKQWIELLNWLTELCFYH